MKKKFTMRLSILSFLLLFVFCGCSFATWSEDEVLRMGYQIFNQIDNDGDGGSFNYSNWFYQCVNSNAYNQYKEQLPFDTSNFIAFLRTSNDEFRLYFADTDSTFYVNSNRELKTNTTFNLTAALRLNFNRSTNEVTYNNLATTWTYSTTSTENFVTPNISGSTAKFIAPLTNNTITNQFNNRIYGLNYTLSTPVYNGSTNVDVGQYYRLCRGFIGNHYYTNYQLLDYKIIGNDTQEFIGNKYVTYTPTSNGQVVDIYFYIEPSMNQKGYRVVTYYNNEVLYSENEYNTLIVNSGGSSGDSGSGGGSIDLTETNNLITGIGTIIKSGDDRIVDAIKSGDNQIIAAITDDSEVDSLLGEIYSSGDDINDIVSDLNFRRYDNPYQNLIFGTIQNICDSLYGSGDAYITINLHNGSQKRIYSSEFYIQDSTLRFFVSSFLIFGILFVLYNYFRKSIDSISSGDAKKVIDNVEVDTNFIKM